MFNSNDRVLVVCAHPDDEVLGCGGTLARLRSMGIPVRIIFLGEGVSARFPDTEKFQDDIVKASEVREGEARAALACLGITDFIFYNNSCCRFDEKPLLYFVRLIESHIVDFLPTVVITHNLSETNIDHKITFSATEVACRPTGGTSVQAVIGMEIVCSGNFVFQQTFQPNLYVDISDDWSLKKEAWGCYANESREFPFPRSLIGLETLARYRGMQSDLAYAEAFMIFRSRL